MDAATLASHYINTTQRHVFLTGKAGTGKTTFLRNIVKNCHKKIIVAAPTGIAAINAGGVTLHSLFHLPFGLFVPDAQWTIPSTISFKVVTPHGLIKDLKMNESKQRLLKEMELLIIDEVSMLRADTLDAIDTILRSVRRNSKISFGGAQVLFIGDMLQLPPVVKQEEAGLLNRFYKSNYFFDAHVLTYNKPIYIELEKIYRQSDPVFVRLLNHLRDHQLDKEDVEVLETRVRPEFAEVTGQGYIHLVTHNQKADHINQAALKALAEKSVIFKAEIEGDFPEFLYPIDLLMELKKGAQVMFVKNDLSNDKKYFNGKIGVIDLVKEDTIEVGFEDGSPTVIVDRYSWENKRYKLNEETNQIEEEIIGRFKQYPLRLAWAITIHKSQGLTFDKAIIDISGAFAPGQVYVALSRLRSLEGLFLTSHLKTNQLMKDWTLLDFTKQKTNHTALSENLKLDSKTYFQRFILNAFDFGDIYQKVLQHLNTYKPDLLRPEKQVFAPWAKQWLLQIETIKTIADKFPPHVVKIVLEASDDVLLKLHERVHAAKKFFQPQVEALITDLHQHIKEIQKIKKAKGYVEELKELDNLCFRQWETICRAESLLKAAISDANFTKDSVLDIALLQQRAEALEEMANAAERKEKQPKGQSKATTLALYKAGKSIVEIAEERQMSVGTIESHLASFIETGEVDVLEFLPKEKYEAIVNAAESLEVPLYGAIKQKLGEGYSYSEIRFAMVTMEKKIEN